MSSADLLPPPFASGRLLAARVRRMRIGSSRRPPAYARPRRIQIVEEVPGTSSGKVDRRGAASWFDAS